MVVEETTPKEERDEQEEGSKWRRSTVAVGAEEDGKTVSVRPHRRSPPGDKCWGHGKPGPKTVHREAASEVETIAVREVLGALGLSVSGIVVPCANPAERRRLGFTFAPVQPETDSGASTEGPDHETSLD